MKSIFVCLFLFTMMALSLAPSNSTIGITSHPMDSLSDEVEFQNQTLQREEHSNGNILESPFSLLTPINETLSGPLWVLTNQLSGQSFQHYSNGNTTGNKVGYSWGSMREIHMPPNTPSLAPSQSPVNQSLVPLPRPSPSI